MIHLLYISTATKEMDENDLLELFEQSRINNKKNNITGVLLYKDHTFIQVIEGEKNQVETLYEKIKKDHRNKNLVLLTKEEISQRSFPEWNMGFEKTSKKEELPDEFIDYFDENYNTEEMLHASDEAMRLIAGFKDYISHPEN